VQYPTPIRRHDVEVPQHSIEQPQPDAIGDEQGVRPSFPQANLLQFLLSLFDAFLVGGEESVVVYYAGLEGVRER
jgi:hypothetical protein